MREHWERVYHSKHNPEISLEKLLGQENRLVQKVSGNPVMEKYADIFANVTYSIAAGVTLDASAGLTPWQVLISRSWATAVNTVAGKPYGWARNLIYRISGTTKEDTALRKGLLELLAFNTIQVPIYVSGLATSQLFTEGSVDWGKVRDGALYLAAASPLIAPTLAYYSDACREVVGLPTAAEKANAPVTG